MQWDREIVLVQKVGDPKTAQLVGLTCLKYSQIAIFPVKSPESACCAAGKILLTLPDRVADSLYLSLIYRFLC